MKKEELYKKVMSIVADVDPMGFLGLPDTDENEYSPEVDDIILHLPLCQTKHSTITIVVGIFNHWFGDGPIEKYEQIGKRVWLLKVRIKAI